MKKPSKFSRMRKKAREMKKVNYPKGERRHFIWLRASLEDYIKRNKIEGKVKDLLLELANTDDAFARMNAMKKLCHSPDKKLLKPLAALVKDPDGGIRMEFAYRLSRLEAKQSLPLLLDLLKDKAWDVKKAAIQSLRKLNDKRAVPGLIEKLKDEDVNVRKEAALALKDLPDKRAVQPLIDFHDRANNSGEKRLAFLALGNCGDKRAIPVMVRAVVDLEASVITEPFRHQMSNPLSYRIDAVSALGELAYGLVPKKDRERLGVAEKYFQNLDVSERTLLLIFLAANPAVLKRAVPSLKKGARSDYLVALKRGIEGRDFMEIAEALGLYKKGKK